MKHDSFDNKLFPQEFFQKLVTLKFLIKKKSSSLKSGNAHGIQRGSGFEFYGFRTYSSGDDFRYLDWNVFARTDQLVIKEFLNEQCLRFMILIDASASMSIDNKFQKILKLAAAFSYLALHNGHSVQIGIIKDKTKYSKKFLGVLEFTALLNFLSQQKTSGIIEYKRTFAPLLKKLSKSIIIYCSDMLDSDGIKGYLEKFVIKNNEILLCHAMSPYEIEPTFSGKACLYDIETKNNFSIVLNKEAISIYKKNLKQFQKRWHSFAIKHGIKYLFTSTAIPTEKIVCRGFNLIEKTFFG